MGIRIPVTLGADEPVALRPFKASKLALVCEGGGQRGIFTAGVLDEFQRASFNPFHLFLGTSAGAQNLSAYVCAQPGYARQVITHYTTRRQFYDPLRFMRGGHLIDLDWLVEITRQELPLAMETAETLFASGREFYMCACRSDDYSAHYFAPLSSNWHDIIRASSAIPGFYRLGVELEGVSYLDGGISDAIPVREAARRGADTIVVIRTVPSQRIYTSKWIRHVKRWLGDSALLPVITLLQHHEQSYLEIQRFIEQPPGELRIIEIYPPKPLASSALGSRVSSLDEDYHLGRQCGRYFLMTIGSWLRDAQSQTSPVIIRPPLAAANASQQRPVITPSLADNDADYDKGSLA